MVRALCIARILLSSCIPLRLVGAVLSLPDIDLKCLFCHATAMYTQQKKLRKMCLRACNTRTVIFHEMCTSYSYEVSFYLSNECLFEMIALTEAWKINVKVDWSCPPFSQNCHIVLFVYQLSLELFHTNNHISIEKNPQG